MRPFIAVALALLIASPAFAQSGPPGGGGQGGSGQGGSGQGGGMGAPGGGPVPQGGPRMRAVKPIKRSTFDDAVEALFRRCDSDRNGIVTPAEVRGIVDARRTALVQARFQRIDSDGNGAVDFAEFSAWQAQMGSAALSEQDAAATDRLIVPAVVEPDLGDREEDMILRQLLEPIGVTMIAGANVDYDSGASLAEMLAWQGQRFARADRNGDGAVSMEEAAPPRRPGAGGEPDGLPPPGPRQPLR